MSKFQVTIFKPLNDGLKKDTKLQGNELLQARIKSSQNTKLIYRQRKERCEAVNTALVQKSVEKSNKAFRNHKRRMDAIKKHKMTQDEENVQMYERQKVYKGTKAVKERKRRKIEREILGSSELKLVYKTK